MKVIRKILKLIGIIFLSFLMMAVISFGIIAYQTSRQKINYQDEIYKYSEKYNIDPLLTTSIIKVESDFDINAHSSQDAMGLMQLLENSAKHSAELIGKNYYPEKLKEVDYNLDLGVGYFNYLNKYYNNKDLALAAYNGGIGNIEKLIEDGVLDKNNPDITKIPIEETRQYVIKINANYDIMQTFYSDGLPSDEELQDRKKLSIKNYKKFLSKIKRDLF